MKGHYKLATIAMLLFILSVVCSSALAINNTKGIAYGVHSNKVDLSGADSDTAQKMLRDQFAKDTAGDIIVLSYDGKEKTIKAGDIDLGCDFEQTVQEAEKIGSGGNFIKNLLDKIICTYYGKNIPLKIIYNEDKLKNILKQTENVVNVKPADAYAYTDGSSVYVTAGKDGRQTDDGQFLAEVSDALAKGIYPQSISVPVNISVPDITSDSLKKINTVMAVYSTNFNAGAVNRSKNIALAARNLSGTLVLPGKVFSFNQTVGPRLAAVGYRDAPVFIDGKVVPGVGGGVCQVSSTLYNAILLAGLTPVERTNHYLPVGYVPRAFDATVADGFIDFKFRNNFQHNIYVYATTRAGTLTIYILGSTEDKAADTISLKNYYNNDGSVSAYRLYSNAGSVAKKEFLHTDK